MRRVCLLRAYWLWGKLLEQRDRNKFAWTFFKLFHFEGMPASLRGLSPICDYRMMCPKILKRRRTGLLVKHLATDLTGNAIVL
jgi:hypothetical protein